MGNIPHVVKLKDAVTELNASGCNLTENYLRSLCWQRIPIFVMVGKCYFINMDKLTDFLNGDLVVEPKEEADPAKQADGFYSNRRKGGANYDRI